MSLGDVVDVKPLTRAPGKLANVADGYLLAYKMPGYRAGEITATGMLFVPKTDAPDGGWPLLVFGHDTEGWTPNAAPSVYVQEDPPTDLPPSSPARWSVTPGLRSFGQPSGHWRCTLQIRAMMDAFDKGMVVFAVDYEGLGPVEMGIPETGHPYFISASTGRSIVYGAVAAKRHLGDKLSGAWASSGFSEGGSACIAASEYSAEGKDIEDQMDYRGAVSFAPGLDVHQLKLDQWTEIEMLEARGSEIPAQGALGQFQHHQYPIMAGAMAAGLDVGPEDVFHERAMEIYNSNPRMLHFDWSAKTREDLGSWLMEGDARSCVDYPGAYNGKKFLKHLHDNCDVGAGHVPGKKLIIEGGADSVTRPDIVIRRTNEMIANGNDVSLCLLEHCDHFNLLHNEAGFAAAKGFLRNIFS